MNTEERDCAHALRLEGSYISRLKGLRPFQIRKVLLVASLYDYFLLEEDGRLGDHLAKAYRGQERDYVPVLTQVSGGEAALRELDGSDYDLVVSVMRVGDMDPNTFAARVKQVRPGTPFVMIAYNTPELPRLVESRDPDCIDRIFVWQGDGSILLGIIELIEDLENAAFDSESIGVQNLLLVEDSIFFYSRYVHRAMDVIRELMNDILGTSLPMVQRKLRARTRPKLLLASSFEEAASLFETYGPNILGVISDLCFPRGGKEEADAGPELAQLVRESMPGLPILFQSSRQDAARVAGKMGVGLLRKDSPTLMADLEGHLRTSFGFGDLVFRAEDGSIKGTVGNVDALYLALGRLDPAVVSRYVVGGELTRWLRVHTELELADRISSLSGAERSSAREIRDAVLETMRSFREESHRGSVVTYSRAFYEDYSRFSKLGGGSVGGKGRGLAFMDKVLTNNLDPERFRKISISVPRTLVLGTDVFDQFMTENDLLGFALGQERDLRIINRFLQSDLPPTILGDLRDFARAITSPLAVRSSSLLEDALYQPFAGIYYTKMLPNNHMEFDSRFRDLTGAIKLVYASTFLQGARSYIEATNHRAEEEKMAILIQEVVGDRHGTCFYPHISGVGRSYDYYPVGSAVPEDGVVNLALGLGKTVVDGGVSLRFTPRYPGVLPQFPDTASMLRDSQKTFWAIDMGHSSSVSMQEDEDQYLLNLGLERAEEQGVLEYLASTYSPQDDVIYDGVNRAGPRVLNFAHVLKNRVIPLAEILDTLLKMGEQAMACPVEIEFAVRLGSDRPTPAHFHLLQIRPMVVGDELVEVDLQGVGDEGSVLVYSEAALGNGVIESLMDIIYVDPEAFDASSTREIVEEIGSLNRTARERGDKYLLIGPGRWGSSDPWLGIPVCWNHVSNARVIVETGLANMNVDPSQGSHFFQNLTSLRIGYFTVPWQSGSARIDWEWLASMEPAESTEHVRRLRLDNAIRVMIDGRSGKGLILKPSVGN
ncbi:hypothetical protein JW921_01620 [Candidatus Fermentibacterales bacterium]|nr:hypothetical protein [Candidatus Fermentibacterales bacterium]